MAAVHWLFDNVDCTIATRLDYLIRGAAKTLLLPFLLIYIGVSFVSFEV